MEYTYGDEYACPQSGPGFDEHIGLMPLLEVLALDTTLCSNNVALLALQLSMAYR